MAEPTTSKTYQDIYYAVGRKLFNEDSGMSAEQKAIAERIAKDGYRTALGFHKWSFLEPGATLSVTGGDTETNLPDDFEAMLADFSFEPDKASSMVRCTVERIYEMRSLYDGEATYPSYFAIQTVVATGSTGQRYKALWYPTPTGDLTLYYRYRVNVDVFTSDTDVLPGGPTFALLVEACALWRVEMEKGEVRGAQWRLIHGDGRPGGETGLLEMAIQRDNEKRPSRLGQLLGGDGATYGTRVWPSSSTTVTFSERT